MGMLAIARDGTPVLSAEVAGQLAELEREARRVREAREAIHAALLDEMERRHVIKVETPELVVSYVAATDRERLDSKALRRDHPDLYDEYARISPVKASVRVRAI